MHRVLVVDDHPLYRSALSELIARIDGFTVAAALGSLEEATAFLGREPCDLVLLDLRLPGVAGVDGVRAIRHARAGVRIAVVSGNLESSVVSEALAAGATGFLPKSYDPEVLAAALRLIVTGAIYVPHDLAATAPAEPARPAAGREGLTERELQILQRMASGATYKEIAREVGIAEITVKLHAQRIAQKMGARNRAAAIALAVQKGIVNPTA